MSKTDRTSCRDARRRVEFEPIWRARSSLARTHLACLFVAARTHCTPGSQENTLRPNHQWPLVTRPHNPHAEDIMPRVGTEDRLHGAPRERMSWRALWYPPIMSKENAHA